MIGRFSREQDLDDQEVQRMLRRLTQRLRQQSHTLLVQQHRSSARLRDAKALSSLPSTDVGALVHTKAHLEKTRNALILSVNHCT